MKHDKTIKMLSLICAVLILGYAFTSLYSHIVNKCETETAYVSTISESTDADMFIIRSETVIEGTGEGVVVPLAVNGERVSNGSKIAALFSSETAAENYSNLISLNKKLETYKKIDSGEKLANLDLDKLETEIDNEFYSMLDAVWSNDFSSLSEDELEFEEKLSRKNISLGVEVDCSQQIAELQNQISALSGTDPEDVVLASAAGYFVSRPDGYEKVLTTDDINGLTEEKLQKAFEAEKEEVGSGTIGKLINGYDWYIASCVTSSAVAALSEGNKVKIVLGDSDAAKVSATVYSNTLIEGNKSLVIFKCTYMNDTLATLRKVSGKIITGSYKGIKIKKDAVRFNDDGDEGVYIKEGDLIKFNKIKEIYSGDNFVVARDMSGSSGWLAKYDEIVVSGKELSNGKVLK